jgi:hypothetical protein
MIQFKITLNCSEFRVIPVPELQMGSAESSVASYSNFFFCPIIPPLLLISVVLRAPANKPLARKSPSEEHKKLAVSSQLLLLWFIPRPQFHSELMAVCALKQDIPQSFIE